MTAKTDPAQDERERVEEAFRRGIGPVSTCAACAPAVQAALKQAVNVTIGLRADDARAHARAVLAARIAMADEFVHDIANTLADEGDELMRREAMLDALRRELAALQEGT